LLEVRSKDLLSCEAVLMTDPRSIMVVIGFVGTAAQGLAAWWWFQVSCRDFADDSADARKELREIGRLNARAAIAQSVAATCAVILWLTGAYLYQ
jgi:hypothetical protein